MAEESKYAYDEESVKVIIEWAQTAQLPKKVMLSEAEHIFDTLLYVNANIRMILSNMTSGCIL